MLLLMTAVAIYLGARATYQKFYGEQAAIRRLKELGAEVVTEAMPASWLEGLLAGGEKVEHAVAVALDAEASLLGIPPMPGLRAPKTSEVCEETCLLLERLPNLRKLSLMGQPIGDRELRHLSTLRNLNTVILAGTQVTIGGVEKLADACPDIDIDVGVAEPLYRETQRMFEANILGYGQAVYRFQKAAEWKLACASFKSEDAKAAAYEQLASCLERLGTYQKRVNAAPRTAGTYRPQEIAYVQCAMWQARVRSGLAEGRRREALRASKAGAQEALRLIPPAWRKSPAVPTGGAVAQWGGLRGPVPMILALEMSTNIEVARAELSGDRDAVVDVLQSYVSNLEKVRRHIEPLYNQALPGGAGQKWIAAKAWLQDARARLARRLGNRDREVRILSEAEADATHMREIAEAAYQCGVVTLDLRLTLHEKANAMEASLRRALGDETAEDEVRQRHAGFIETLWHKAYAGVLFDAWSHDDVHLARCLHATERLRRRGRELYESPVAEIEYDYNGTLTGSPPARGRVSGSVPPLGNDAMPIEITGHSPTALPVDGPALAPLGEVGTVDETQIETTSPLLTPRHE